MVNNMGYDSRSEGYMDWSGFEPEASCWFDTLLVIPHNMGYDATIVPPCHNMGYDAFAECGGFAKQAIFR